MSNLSDYHLYLHPPKLDRDYHLFCLRYNSRAYNFRVNAVPDLACAIRQTSFGGWPFTHHDESALTYLGTLDQFPELLL